MSVESLVELISPELLLAVGSFIFTLLVVPTLLDSDAAIPRSQSVSSAFVLLVCFAIPYYTLGFYGSALANILGVVLWSVVAVYRAPESTRRVATETKESETSAQSAD